MIALPPWKKRAPLPEFCATRHPETVTLLVASIPPPRLPSNAVLPRIAQRVNFKDVTDPAEIAPPATPAELPVKTQSTKTALPLSSTRTAPPRLDAELPVKIEEATVGLPKLTRSPPPRSSGAAAPVAFPPVIVKPSRTAEDVTVESAVTTW
jgi:hypothetical protein